MTNFPQVETVVSQVLGIPETSITDDSAPENTLEWDSFNSMALIAELEKTYSIDFTFEEAAQLKSVSEIKKLLRAKGVEA